MCVIIGVVRDGVVDALDKEVTPQDLIVIGLWSYAYIILGLRMVKSHCAC